MVVGGVLPSLREQPVVPVDVVGVKAELPLLQVLLDGVSDLVLCTGECVIRTKNCNRLHGMNCMAVSHSGELHFRRCLPGYLADVVEIARRPTEQRDVVPSGHHLFWRDEGRGAVSHKSSVEMGS